MNKIRITAILTTYNEERFVCGCLDHLIAHGINVYLVDESSTDRTVELAERYLGQGLLAIEQVARHGVMNLEQQLAKKEHLAATLDSDWFIHVDADEIRLPWKSTRSLAEAIADVDAQGYNAVNFQEFTFVPTLESPDHDHPDFQKTMRSYYPFLPKYPHRLNAWKRQDQMVDLVASGGHRVAFENLRMFPRSFAMRHYLYLSVPHAIQKYVRRVYDPHEVKRRRWSVERDRLTEADVKLTSQAILKNYHSDDRLDASNPRTKHFLFDIPPRRTLSTPFVAARKLFSTWIGRRSA